VYNFQGYADAAGTTPSGETIEYGVTKMAYVNGYLYVAGTIDA